MQKSIFDLDPKNKKELRLWVENALKEEEFEVEDNYIDLLIEHSKLGFYLDFKEQNQDTTSIKSYLFGAPLLPTQTEWPRTSDGTYYTFLFQLNCAELPLKSDLPSAGLLSFFMNMSYSKDWQNGIENCKVFYFPNIEALEERQVPSDFESQNQFKQRKVSFEPFHTFPRDIQDFDDSFNNITDAMEICEDHSYSDFSKKFGDYEPSLVSGNPFPVQTHPYFEVELFGIDYMRATELEKTELSNRAKENISLFQLSPQIEELEAHWGDNTFYFVMKKSDLYNLDFSQVKLVAQCT